MIQSSRHPRSSTESTSDILHAYRNPVRIWDLGDGFTMVVGPVAERSAAERHMLAAVQAAREAGLSWAAIGSLVGTSGEAARQRYSDKVA